MYVCRSKINFILSRKFLLSAFLAFFSGHARADVMDWVKGCIIMGGAGVGGAVMAASASNVEFKDTQALVIAGATSCLIGGFISSDIVKKAEMRASAELAEKNSRLKHGVYGVMHDLCVIKGTCGADGLPFAAKENKDYDPLLDYQGLKSGN